jgi:hypothetical protein
MFFKLEAGDYLICISACRHELFTYGVGMIIEFQRAADNIFALTEDAIQSFLLQEAAQVTDIGSVYEEIASPVTTNELIDEFNAATFNEALIESGVTVQVNYQNTDDEKLTWYIGPLFPSVASGNDQILLDPTDNWVDSLRERSLFEWKTAWERENIDSFPAAVFAPYATTQ